MRFKFIYILNIRQRKHFILSTQNYSNIRNTENIFDVYTLIHQTNTFVTYWLDNAYVRMLSIAFYCYFLFF